MANVVILGAGLAGLSTAYHLEKLGLDYDIYEKESRVGGLCRSEIVDGFTFDYTGHLLHFRDSYARSLVGQLLGGNLLKRERNSWVYSKGVYTRYPFQSNLYGLPLKTKLECILGLMEARSEKPSLDFLQLRSGQVARDREAKSQRPIAKGRSFEEWIYSNFGRGIAKHFMIPYNLKLWGTPLSELTPAWTGRFVPKVTLREVLKGAFSQRGVRKGYNVVFYYPKHGGIEALPLALASKLREVNLRREAVSIDWRGKRVKFADGSWERYSVLVSTIPLPELVDMLRGAPAWVYERKKLLRWLGVMAVNLGIGRPSISDRHWVYVPENEFAFYRAGFPMNFSSSLVPEGKSSIYTEISYLQGIGDEDRLVSEVVEDLEKMRILKKGEPLSPVKLLDIKYAYILYDHEYRESRGEILGWLKSQSIYPTGRFGNWVYSTMEDVILEGRDKAEKIRIVLRDRPENHPQESASRSRSALSKCPESEFGVVGQPDSQG